MKVPIGSVSLQLAGYEATATLHDDGGWHYTGDHMVAHHLKHAAHRVDAAAPPAKQLEQLAGAIRQRGWAVEVSPA